ncbi:MAG: S-layer homology domain-containing protein, partial [Oscillospiraceae bacterium]
ITIGKAAVTVGPNVLTYTATGLTNSTACTATVAAINSVGTGATGTATATPKAPVTPPTPTPPPTPDDGGNTGNGGNGGEASTGNKTETVQNADGSTTITVTNQASGTVTETTQRKDGSKTVVETKKDGTVTTTDTLKNGVKSTTVSTPDGTTTATVDLPAGVEIARIALPVEGANAGTVVVLVHADGTRELIRKSMVKDGKLLFTLDADAKLEIRDNAKSFPDTQHHWANQAIAFVTAHELFSGVTDKKFDPNRDMNRAMLVTVLYRLEGTPKAGAASFADVPQDSYYASAAAWAMENGILLGNAKGDLDPDSSITREAMVTLLYRYAKGSPAAEGLGGFNDTGAVSDFAKEAMSWGVANGIINGKAGGKLDPKGTATRGEVATMLQRFVEQLVK